MPPEPETKRAVAFIDGQNLFYAAKAAFGYHWPNYAPQALARKVCDGRGWELVQTRFYTGIPSPEDDARKHAFWTKKMAFMGTRGVITYSRPLRYRNRVIELPGGGSKSILVGQEKGIDIRIALDIVRFAMNSDPVRSCPRSVWPESSRRHRTRCRTIPWESRSTPVDPFSKPRAARSAAAGVALDVVGTNETPREGSPRGAVLTRRPVVSDY